MDYSLNDEQQLIQDTARDFAKTVLEPAATCVHEDRELFLQNLKALSELGFMGLNVSEKYGGTGAGVVAFSVAITEIAKACASTAVTVSVNNMVAETIEAKGSDEQKARYLPQLCGGGFPAGCFCLSEAEAGSDPSSMRTKATRDGDSWVINGTKLYITSAEYAGFFIVWAVTDSKVRKGAGISCFLVDADTPGITISPAENKLGQKASSTNEVIFDNCRVPLDAMMGEENAGFRIATSELAGGRIGIASLALGIGLAAMEYSTEFAKQRKQFDKPISEFQGIQWMIAETYTELEAARLLTLQSAYLKEAKKPYALEASMAKLYSAEKANDACNTAVQLLGGAGYLADHPVERFLRDVRITTIYEGSSQIQKVIISKQLLNRT